MINRIKEYPIEKDIEKKSSFRGKVIHLFELDSLLPDNLQNRGASQLISKVKTLLNNVENITKDPNKRSVFEKIAQGIIDYKDKDKDEAKVYLVKSLHFHNKEKGGSGNIKKIAVPDSYNDENINLEDKYPIDLVRAMSSGTISHIIGSKYLEIDMRNSLMDSEYKEPGDAAKLEQEINDMIKLLIALSEYSKYINTKHSIN